MPLSPAASLEPTTDPPPSSLAPYGTVLTIPPPALFFGPFLDAAPAAAPAANVIALIDGVECGRTRLATGDGGEPVYRLHVLSDAARTGCGTLGATVDLMIDDQPVGVTTWNNGVAQCVELGAAHADAGATPSVDARYRCGP